MSTARDFIARESNRMLKEENKMKTQNIHALQDLTEHFKNK